LSPILYAPNVHSGGGLVLLKALINDWPNPNTLIAFLDERVSDQFDLPKSSKIFWVKPTILSRLYGELKLRKIAGKDKKILCFHGLPPIFANKFKIAVFFQNRDYLGLNKISSYSFKIGLRLFFERLISRIFSFKVDQYIVQTRTMHRDLIKYFSSVGSKDQFTAKVNIIPFNELLPDKQSSKSEKPKYDFLYISSGEPHKNHNRLFSAWTELAKEGIKPSLVTTLGPKDQKLIDLASEIRNKHGAKIINISDLNRDEIYKLYSECGAFIFPSMGESFGLPLIEAKHFGLPILAPEMDYVRDVCKPIQTFDPNSTQSIIRAIKRYTMVSDSTSDIYRAEEFLEQVECNFKKLKSN
tara:strand:- start:69 stop:1133 length:1065 start_codon:yes stop_codon:yes gene_type:complete